ncbi:helix-turn-helix transcriptional regulator [uncultured Maricaulis sp.]|uniref:helix-turn-helix transcriptional regulator n=1 Tax=uncultured Maricaulis sp. TaxID=174710 RepID=UPI002619A2E4|nr:helix-turn-helix transcriptional regulator [uncultured Maricaulis sp.]
MSLKSLRKAKGWSQAELARISDLSERTIQRIESGRPASLEALKALATSFDLSIEDLQARLKTPAAPPPMRPIRKGGSPLVWHGLTALGLIMTVFALGQRFDADPRLAGGTAMLGLASWLLHLAVSLHRADRGSQ